MIFWTRKQFYSDGSVVAYVRDVATAQRWYAEKLGLRYFSTKVEEASMEVGYSPKDVVVCFVEVLGSEQPKGRPQRPPIVFARNLAAAHEYLSSRNVNVSPIQKDYGGNPFFRFWDLDGNELEICKEP